MLRGKCNNDYNDNNRFVGYRSHIRTVLPGEEPFSHIPTYPYPKLAQEVVWNIYDVDPVNDEMSFFKDVIMIGSIINPFFPTATFLNPLKTENLTVHWEQMD